jgi:hypothetical protein
LWTAPGLLRWKGGQVEPPEALAVAEFIHTAIDRAKPALEEYIGQYLRYLEPFPFTLTDAVAALRNSEACA